MGKKIENLKQHCQLLTIVLHGGLIWCGDRPTYDGGRRANLHVGWEDFAIFGKNSVTI